MIFSKIYSKPCVCVCVCVCVYVCVATTASIYFQNELMYFTQEKPEFRVVSLAEDSEYVCYCILLLTLHYYYINNFEKWAWKKQET